MNNSKYIFLLLLLTLASAVDYYIEPAPTAPRLCTLTRPCTISLLPSLTSADTVHFLPATTGISNTYAFGTKVINAASVIIDSPLISFSGSTLRNVKSNSFTLNSARFSSGSLSTQEVSTVTISGANFTNGAYVVFDGSSITVSTSSFTGVSGSNRHIFYGTTVEISELQFTDSKSSGHLVSFQPSVTFGGTLNLNVDAVSFSNCNTTSTSSSIFAIQTIGGRSVNAGGISDLSFVNCNSKAALFLARCIYQPGTTEFSIVSSLSGMDVSGGSVLKGLIALESNSPQATINHNTDGLNAVGTDFGSNAVYTLSNAGSKVTQNNVLGGSNSVCESTNLNYIASCAAVMGASVENDYALIRGTYANVTTGPFNACTNTTLDIQEVCGMD
jgi:hypothetical protein